MNSSVSLESLQMGGSTFGDSIVSSAAEEVMPNLPGFRRNTQRSRNKVSNFQVVGGLMCETSQPPIEVGSLMKSASATSIHMGRATPHHTKASKAQYITNSTLVLSFDAYFKEAVHESRVETHRIRQCTIFYYLEDDSLHIVEKRQENSGIPQGTFVRRHQVPKDEDNFYTLDDLVVGSEIVVYGRSFRIVNCNPSTARYLKEKRGEDVVPEEVPHDTYDEARREFMSRETGGDPTVSHNILKNPMKAVAEAALGHTVDNSGREGFLKYDRMVLRFNCIWDDRDKLYGDLQLFKVHYFLADDTVEVLSVYGGNSGRDPFPLLLKRAKLPTGEPDCHYHWTDISVGSIINVYSRELLVVDADDTTRQWYEKNDMPLDTMTPPHTEEPPVYERAVPPYTGFGSEEDSLSSCVGSLVPRAAKAKNFVTNKILRYVARLESGRAEDEDRQFVIQYFLADNTIFVREPPRRNSGIVGGNFLARMKIKDQSGMLITQDRFYIGSRVMLNAYQFTITASDEATLKYMEINRVDTFPHSNYHSIIEMLSDRLTEAAQDGSLSEAFEATATKRGGVGLDELRSVMSQFGVGGRADVPEQAFVTIVRKLGHRKSPLFLYSKFVDHILDPSAAQDEKL